MPMYLILPVSLFYKGNKLSVLVPAQPIQSKTEPKFDELLPIWCECYNRNLPMLGVKATALVQGI